MLCMLEQIILVNKKDLPILKKDFLTINKMSISDESNGILLRVTYHGGCKEHTFKLYGYYENKRKMNLCLEHNAHDDKCKRIIKEDLVFDLSPIREYYAKGKKNTIFSSLILRMGKLEVEYSYT
jgi:hypothetical protein